MKSIIIWGTKYVGQKTFNILQEYQDLQVIAFGDNDPKQWGKTCCGKNIISAEEVLKLKDLDGIVIAASSKYVAEIYAGLAGMVEVPIYRDVYELISMRASIDISGWCNAQCKWCATGKKNRSGVLAEHTYISLEKFKKIYEHLLETNILNKFNEILLYDWGEPFLNPDCMNILEYLSQNNQIYSMSTNASILKLAQKPGIYKQCRTFIFSMPGFSQESYDKIHRFSFEKIKSNIKAYMENIREFGFEGEAILSYHVYQFNIKEIPMARAFAESLGIKFVPIYAYFADFELMEEYIMDKMPQETRKEAEQELVLQHVPRLLKSRPDNFRCLVENMISVNTNGQIELCCCAGQEKKDYVWGSVFELKSYDEWRNMRETMLNSEMCKLCRKMGVDYWFFNNPSFEEKANA